MSYFVSITCLDCDHNYKVKILNAVEEDGFVDGYTGSDADFCVECDSDNLETVAIVARKVAS